MENTVRTTKGFAAWWFYKGKYWVSHILLSIVALTMCIPFAWMVLMSFKSNQEVALFNPLPTVWHFDNYPKVFAMIPFARYYFNSLFVALWVTFLQVLTSSMAAFAFARLQWKGRDTVFKLYLATLMIPGVVTMIPNFALMVKLHLMDSYAGLIVPAAFTAFGTFMLRQFMMTIPPALDEAAKVDGASHWQVFWNLILPLSRAGLITLGILTLIGTFGSFYWPLIMIKSEFMRPLPVGLLYFDNNYTQQTELLMAATVMNIIPLIIVFIVFQKFLVKGIQLGAVKG